ncbi:MAG: response regulator [Alphaproteobacteria bacterium]|nr:response regulator [Alphaproteobacteria bacterium]
MPSPNFIYIVDDDEAVRQSLATLLEAVGYNVRSFAEAELFLEAAASLPPGCLIADVRMPGIDGLELQRRLHDRALRFPVIIVTGHADVPLAVRAMKAGALDIIEKPFTAPAILTSVRAALAQSASEPPQSAGHDAADPEAVAKIAQLSPREREVLAGLLAGLPNKTMAYDLSISPRTVEIHRARVMDKTSSRSLSELIRLALAAGLQPRA